MNIYKMHTVTPLKLAPANLTRLGRSQLGVEGNLTGTAEGANFQARIYMVKLGTTWRVRPGGR